MSTNYRQDIQVLRGIAVIAVLLFHTLGETFPLGYLGVDVFFVISGFVIAPLMLRILQEDGDLEDRIRRLRQFLKSRFSRLAPALVVTLIIFTFIMFLLGPVQDHQRVARQGVASLLLMGNFGAYKYQGDYFTPAANPLVHTWSLSVEAQIYILLPLLLMVFFQKKSLRTKNVYIFFSAVSIISFGSFLITLKSSEIFSALGVEGTTQFSFYWTMNRVWQFSIGTLAYLLVSHSKIRMIRGRKILNVLLGIFLVIILFSRLSISLSSGSVLASFIALAILVNRSLEVLPKIVLYTFEWIGNRSYSIYLVHMPILYIVNLWPLEDLSNQIPELIRSILVIGGSVFLGRVLFEKIEKRFRYESILNLRGIKNSFYVFVAILLMPILLLLGLDQSSALLTFERGMPPKPKILPWDWDEECKFYSTSLRVIDEPCTYSHLGSDKSIMLIGDSHAASISQMVVKLGESLGMNTFIFTMEGCGFLLNRLDSKPSLKFPFLTPECIKHNNAILAYVKQLKPTVVVWGHHSSSIYVSPNNSESRLYFNQQQKNSFNTLKAEQSSIINIGSVPEFLPISSRLEALLGKEGKFSEIPFQDHSFWNANWEKEKYINSLDIFCPKGFCINKSKKNWLFVDENHLSTEGAVLLQAELRRVVLKLVSKDPI